MDDKKTRALTPFMQTFNALPSTLPVFPLPSTVLLPAGHLPLNIFEPRYLNMVQDAMKSHRLIGMILPRDDKREPELFKVGCAGRITRYEETGDGRLEITLTGLCRYKIKEELNTTRGYRLIVPDWSDFEIDYEEQAQPDSLSIMAFNNAIRAYFKQNNMQADWSVLDKFSIEGLVNSLFNYLPLSVEDKQFIIEADTLANRLIAFTAILERGNEASKTAH